MTSQLGNEALWRSLRDIPQRARPVIIACVDGPGRSATLIGRVLGGMEQRTVQTYAGLGYKALGVSSWAELQEKANELRQAFFADPIEAKKYIDGARATGDYQFKLSDQLDELIAQTRNRVPDSQPEDLTSIGDFPASGGRDLEVEEVELLQGSGFGPTGTVGRLLASSPVPVGASPSE